MAGRDKEVTVGMTFEDDYSGGVKRAKKETEDLDKSMRDVNETSMEANIRFQTTLEAVDKLGGGVSKIRAGMEDLGLANEEVSESLRKVEGAADLMVGSAEIGIITMEAWTRASKNQRLALLGVATAAAAVGLATIAMNAETDEARAQYSAMTGVAAGLAAAEFALAAAKAAGWTASSGPASPAMAALIAGSLVALAAGMATFWASTQSTAETAPPGLQTGMGEFKTAEVTATGDVILRPGDQITATRQRRVTVHQGETARVERAGTPMAEMRPTGRFMGPLIGTVNFIGWWEPLSARGQAAAGDMLGEYVVRKTGGLLR